MIKESTIPARRDDDSLERSEAGEALVVEDSYFAAADLAQMLQKLGWRVRVVNGASSAIAMAEQSPPDVAFIDINLEGGFEGFDVAREIERRSGAAIAFVTAYTAEDLRGRLEPFRNAVTVFKPVNRSSLETALRMIRPTGTEPQRSRASD